MTCVGTATTTPSRALTSDVGGLQQVQLQEGLLGGQCRVGFIGRCPTLQLHPSGTVTATTIILAQPCSLGGGARLCRGGAEAAVGQRGDAQWVVAGVWQGTVGLMVKVRGTQPQPGHQHPLQWTGGFAYLPGEAVGRLGGGSQWTPVALWWQKQVALLPGSGAQLSHCHLWWGQIPWCHQCWGHHHDGTFRWVHPEWDPLDETPPPWHLTHLLARRSSRHPHGPPPVPDPVGGARAPDSLAPEDTNTTGEALPCL